MSSSRSNTARISPRPLNRRALIQQALGLGLSVGMLAACGGPDNADGTVTLTSWDYFDDTPQFISRFSNFTKNNPNVKFDRSFIPYDSLNTRILQAASSGALPDLVLFNGVDHSRYSSQGLLVDITDRLRDAGLTDKYFPGPLQSGEWDGKNYGIPDGCNCLALYYNADLLDAAGVTPPTTWEELRSTAKTLTKDGVYGFGMAGINQEGTIFQFLPYLWQAGADLDSLDTPAATEALALLTSLIQDGSMSREVVNWAQGDVFTQFINGNLAMCENGPWEIPSAQEEAAFKWGVVPLPKGQQAATTMGGETWAITTSSKSIDAAWNFLLSTQEPDALKSYQSIGGSLPTRKDIADDPVFDKGDAFEVFIEQMSIARPRTYGQNYPEMSIALQDALQNAFTGTMTPAEAMAQANSIIKPLISQ